MVHNLTLNLVVEDLVITISTYTKLGSKNQSLKLKNPIKSMNKIIFL